VALREGLQVSQQVHVTARTAVDHDYGVALPDKTVVEAQSARTGEKAFRRGLAKYPGYREH
jgi:hypothetical protein